MRFFVWYITLVFFWILFDISFIEILFPNVKTPVIVLALIVSFGLTFSFERGLSWALITMVLFDILRTGALTPFFFFVLPLIFIVGFFSHHFLPKDRTSLRPLTLALFLCIILFYESFVPFLSQPSLVVLFIGVLAFPAVHFSVSRINEWLLQSSLSEFRGLRQASK